MPDRHPERPVAAWARGREAARTSSSAAEMPAPLLVVVVVVTFFAVADVAAGRRCRRIPLRVSVVRAVLLVVSPHVISGLSEKRDLGLVECVKVGWWGSCELEGES